MARLMTCCSLFVVVVAVLLAAPVLLAPAIDLAPDLKGQVAIVTGASRGIGRGIAVGLGEQGCTVYVTGRTLDATTPNTAGPGGIPQKGTLRDTCAAVEEAGGKCIPVQVDNGNDQQLQALFEQVMQVQCSI